MYSPLNVSHDELADIIDHIAECTTWKGGTVPVDRVPYERKNRINNMTQEYAKYMRNTYIGYDNEIESFLAAPENAQPQQKYESATEEFRY